MVRKALLTAVVLVALLAAPAAAQYGGAPTTTPVDSDVLGTSIEADGGERLQLRSSDGGSGGALASTGTDTSVPLARLGAVLLASGAVAVYAAKKRSGRRAIFIAS